MSYVVHNILTKKMTEEGILVKFKFDDQKKSEVARLSYSQYQNLKILPITILCEIVDGAEHVLSDEDTKLLNEKIIGASSHSHTKNLSEN